MALTELPIATEGGDGEPPTEEERLDAARATWRQGLQERVRSVESVLSLSATGDLPTPMADEEALGGKLPITAEFKDGAVEIGLSDLGDAPPASR